MPFFNGKAAGTPLSAPLACPPAFACLSELCRGCFLSLTAFVFSFSLSLQSEKGTKGIDGRVISDKGTKGIAGKGQRAFVITLGRAGEDNKSFKITDFDQTFAGFAAADYDLQVR